MKAPRIAALSLAATVVLALAACGGTQTASAPPAATNLSQVGLVCLVNMPGVVGPGESVSITAHNTSPAVHVFLQSVQVGGYDAIGSQVGPDVVTVNRWITLGPNKSKLIGTFAVSDPALETVGAVGGICLAPDGTGGAVTGTP